MAARRKSASAGSATLELHPVLDIRQARPLADQLKSMRGKALSLDAGAVERLGGQCLQVLLAARNGWASDGVAFRLGGASEAFLHDLTTLGLAPEALNHQEDKAA